METNAINKIEFIKDNINKLTWPEMAKHLQVSDRYLRKLSQKHNITKILKRLDTNALQYIKENINKKTWNQMSKHLGFSISALTEFADKHNIYKITKELNSNDIEYLRNHINLKSWTELAKHFNYSKNAIKNICKQNNIVKEQWSHKKIRDRIEQTRTWNKNWSIENGTVKSSKRKWLLEKWIKHNGPLPKNHVLVFNGFIESFEELILINKKELNGFLRKRNARKRELEWSNKLLNKDKKIEFKPSSIGTIATEELANNRVPVRINHKTIKFVDINKCYKDEFNNWKLK